MSLSISHINKIVHFPCHVALWRWWRGAVVIWRKQEPLRSEIILWYCTILIRVPKSRTLITSTLVSDKNNFTLKTWKKEYSLPRLSHSLG